MLFWETVFTTKGWHIIHDQWLMVAGGAILAGRGILLILYRNRCQPASTTSVEGDDKGFWGTSRLTILPGVMSCYGNKPG